jgi:hypothetical protein
MNLLLRILRPIFRFIPGGAWMFGRIVRLTFTAKTRARKRQRTEARTLYQWFAQGKLSATDLAEYLESDQVDGFISLHRMMVGHYRGGRTEPLAWLGVRPQRLTVAMNQLDTIVPTLADAVKRAHGTNVVSRKD